MNSFWRTLSDAIALNADADTLMSTHLGLEKVGGHIYFFQFLIWRSLIIQVQLMTPFDGPFLSVFWMHLLFVQLSFLDVQSFQMPPHIAVIRTILLRVTLEFSSWNLIQSKRKVLFSCVARAKAFSMKLWSVKLMLSFLYCKFKVAPLKSLHA